MKKKKIAVLISGGGSNLQALIDACNKPEYPAQIVSVICNKDDAYGLKRAEAANIPYQIIRHTDYPGRVDFDNRLNQAILESGAEYVCLAGFMRLLTADFVNKWQGRMLNIHPSLLPLFKGIHTHEQAIAAKVKIHGCSVHYVVPEMDAGELIIQAAVPVLKDDTAQSLRDRVLTAEHIIYPLALQKVITGKIDYAQHDNILISV